MKTVEKYFQNYAAFHKTPGNKLTHLVGIPLIVLSLLGLLSHFILADPGLYQGIIRLDLGVLLWAFSMTWYLILDWKIAIPFGFFTFGIYLISCTMNPGVLWALFIVGWILQLVGHSAFEKKSPAFLKNAEHLLIGPFWIFARITGFID